MNMTQTTAVLCTCPDKQTAHSIATSLLQQKLAACVNIIPGIVSIYAWEGQIEQSEEHLLLIKTTTTAYTQVEQAIKEIHPYELPEVISVPITMGSEAYLSWVEKNVIHKNNEV